MTFGTVSNALFLIVVVHDTVRLDLTSLGLRAVCKKVCDVVPGLPLYGFLGILHILSNSMFAGRR